MYRHFIERWIFILNQNKSPCKGSANTEKNIRWSESPIKILDIFCTQSLAFFPVNTRFYTVSAIYDIEANRDVYTQAIIETFKHLHT